MSDAEAARPRRRGWLVPVLAVSLAFNLFLAGGFVGTMAFFHSIPQPGERFAHIAEKVQLTPPQSAAFAVFIQTMQQSGKSMRDANHRVWAQLGDPVTDKAQIKPLLDQTLQNRQAYQNEVATSLGNFLASLTPDQRSRFVEEARNESRAPGPMHMLKGILP
jgi:Spy/CpxP family protein refolding chaperone